MAGSVVPGQISGALRFRRQTREALLEPFACAALAAGWAGKGCGACAAASLAFAMMVDGAVLDAVCTRAPRMLAQNCDQYDGAQCRGQRAPAEYWPHVPSASYRRSGGLGRLGFGGQCQGRNLPAFRTLGEMAQNLRPLALRQRSFEESCEEVGVRMLELPIVDCRSPIVLIAEASSLEPLQHDFGYSPHT